MKRLKPYLLAKNLWIAGFLLMANGLAWFTLAGRVELTAVEPILHPDVAEVRAHWQARDAIGEPFRLHIDNQGTMETITWFIQPRPNLPFSHPQVAFHEGEVVGGGFVHVAGMKLPVFGRATVQLIDGKPVGTLHELTVSNAQAPQVVIDLVDQAQGIYDQLSLPIEITRLELHEGEAIIEGVYR